MSHTRTHADLIRSLRAKKFIKSDIVEQSMLLTDRKYYCPFNPYFTSPQSIGYDATISAPNVHAIALELLKGQLTLVGSRALDVGSGSGYLTACMARMIGDGGKVVGIEHIDELVMMSRKNIKKDNNDLLSTGKVILIVGDGREGYAAEAPYNAIHVGAAASSVPQPLLDQLAAGGRMVIPVGESTLDQKLEKIDKTVDGSIKRQTVIGVAFVPLTNKPGRKK